MKTARNRLGFKEGYPLLIVGGILVLILSLCGPASAQEVTGTFNELAFNLGFGVHGSGGTGGGTQTEMFLSLDFLRFQNLKYRNLGIGFSYRGQDMQDLNAILGRYDWGLKDVRFKGSERVEARIPYLSVMTGYGWGYVWDNVYLPIYGTNEDVEVGVSGIPLNLAVGYREFGGLSWGVEAVVGLFLVTGTDPDEEEADASSTIPSIGIRLIVGYDTFQKSMSYGY